MSIELSVYNAWQEVEFPEDFLQEGAGLFKEITGNTLRNSEVEETARNLTDFFISLGKVAEKLDLKTEVAEAPIKTE